MSTPCPLCEKPLDMIKQNHYYCRECVRDFFLPMSDAEYLDFWRHTPHF